MRPAAVAVGVALAVAACGGGGRGGTVDAGAVRLRVHDAGSAADPVVVAVHGGPGLSLEAMRVYDRLTGDGFRVVAYDQRGAGESTDPDDGRYDLAAHVADLDAVRDSVGARRVSLVGQSWGGAVVAAYAAAHPDRVDAVVLVGAVPLDRAEFRAGQDRFRRRVAALQADGRIPDPLPDAGGGSCLTSFEAAVPAYLADARRSVALDEVSCDAAASRATFRAFVDSSDVEAYGRRLAGYDGRALLVMGEADPFGRPWLDRTAELLAGAEVEVAIVPGAGHLVGAERPDRLLARIRRFLAG